MSHDPEAALPRTGRSRILVGRHNVHPRAGYDSFSSIGVWEGPRSRESLAGRNVTRDHYNRPIAWAVSRGLTSWSVFPISCFGSPQPTSVAGARLTITEPLGTVSQVAIVLHDNWRNGVYG